MILDKINKDNVKYIELRKILNKRNFNLDSFLNIIEFNMMLDTSSLYSSFEINEFIDDLYHVIFSLENKLLPTEYNPIILNNLDIRNLIISLQGFSLTDDNWVFKFAKWIGNRNVLEIMSGLGVLSYGLREKGVSLISTDDYTATNFDFNKLWTNIEKLDALSAIERYGKDIDIIIMSWCYTDETGYECLLKMREINPNAVMIYIGEEPNKSTGSKNLYENMIQIQDKDIDKINLVYPKWNGITDKIYLIK